LPAALPPRGLSRVEAAAYIDEAGTSEPENGRLKALRQVFVFAVNSDLAERNLARDVLLHQDRFARLPHLVDRGSAPVRGPSSGQHESASHAGRAIRFLD